MKRTAPQGVAWLNAQQAADYLGFPSINAFQKWRRASKRPPKTHWIGNQTRFRAADLDRAVDVEPASQPARAFSLVGGTR